jgi:dihydrofolate reductase
MRKLVLSMGVSLDGLVARAGRFGAGGWGLPPEDPALKERKLGWMHDVDLHLMGRNTYEEMAGFWPVSDDPYAAPMNEIPKVVFSRTLERADWADSQIARGDLAEEIAELKREPGKDMLAWGGATFAQSLSRLGLVDEYRLILQPVALGHGLPLFKDLTAPSSSTHRHTPLAPRCTSTAQHLAPHDRAQTIFDTLGPRLSPRDSHAHLRRVQAQMFC